MSDEAPESPRPKKPRHTTRWTLLAIALSLGVAGGVAAYRIIPLLNPEIPDRVLTEDEKDAVFDCMRQALIHEQAARQCVETFGWQALPFYHAVIQDRQERDRTRGNACLLAGLYEVDASTQFIIAFIEEIANYAISQETMSALAVAFDGLGFNGSRDARVYLTQSAMSPDHWLSKEHPPVREGEDTSDGFIGIVQMRSIRALGLMPHGNGIEALETIRQNRPDLAGYCDDAIDDARGRRWGLNRLDDL